MNKIIYGDALASLRGLPDGIVQTCVTSPPYYGLRDYGTETIIRLADDPECTHEWIHEGRNEDGAKVAQCKLCNAVKYDHQIGLEDTPEAYIARLVEVFREVKRVLRDDGTLWVNIGDSYAGSGKGPTGFNGVGNHEIRQGFDSPKVVIPAGLKPKDLIGIPWLLAFALRADGWWLRADLIWHKPNCMPESVEDRPTKAHEYIFLLSKSERYFYDADAIREPLTSWMQDEQGEWICIDGGGRAGKKQKIADRYPGMAGKVLPGNMGPGKRIVPNPAGRNKRSVWTVSTSPFSEAHFATFPPKLIEPCILAGTAPRACEHCGAPWERVTSRGEPMPEPIYRNPVKRLEPGQAGNVGNGNMGFRASRASGEEMNQWKASHPDITIGWQPSCSHSCEGTAQCIVLDPFAGAGTVPLVSIQHHRQYIGIELNPEYVKLINDRIDTVQPVLWEVSA